ncbi:NADH dehydrogenase [ubiquinone] 1 alpha subcomplex subunit 9, mitochondrial [Octopus sinensis]|uniref:NADH dehydrogenase [ubiquinone] 1 alpha subcomplex subunit 9, mitochondrial n=1 Tax=Octopus sinensis TaxID=2607531 RepID=A0A6P7T110_9MOLL|nr:NADH dehydrogenase [ubiquinone] 1 alpha subcomplex subunit 9, mitochondrial [Octopus sinensis]
MAAISRATVVQLGQIGQHIPPVFGCVYVNKRNAGSGTMAAMKRGRGGRSSFSGIVATVFGATGSLGTHVVNKLGKIGSQVIVPYRGEASEVLRLKLCGDLGQILFFPYNLRDDESIQKVMKYSNVVINMVGRDWETRNFKFNDVHVDGARRIARLARECGVERLIHFSSLNASPDPQKIFMKTGSEFLKSKHEGELAVREEFPDATIFRPSDIYGSEDRFLRYYASGWRRGRGHLPLWKKGTETIKAPVFVSDVAEGIMNAIKDPASIGQTYEAIGPNRYYLSDLMDYFYNILRWRGYKRIPISPVFLAKVWAFSYMPSYPLLNFEKLEREHITDVITGCPTLEDLGVKLTHIEERAVFELKPFRMYSYYYDQIGEFSEPQPPPIVA